MLNIYLFELGVVPEINMRRIAKLIDTPNVIHVGIGDSVLNIGEPGEYGYSYSQILRLFPDCGSDTVRVGIIWGRMEGHYETEDPQNLYSDAIVLPISHKDEEICVRSGRTKEEFITQELLARILFLLFNKQKPAADMRDLFHMQARGCIFDRCGLSEDKVISLKRGHIDAMCKGKLVEANVPESIIETVERILVDIRRPSLGDTLQSDLQKPVLSSSYRTLEQMSES